jgi:phospholipase/lecithinase/hemolysin
MRASIFILISTIIFLSSCGKEDVNPPVVSLNGESMVQLLLGGSYTEAGATASDEEDGVLTVNISGEVNTDFAGIYILRYSASDMAGNTGESFRTIHIANTAGFLKGNYKASTLIEGVNTAIFGASVASSTTVNNRIWLSGFSETPELAVYADISDTTLAVPAQASFGGNPPADHFVTGSGYFMLTADTIYISINFTDSTNQGKKSGQTTYKSHRISNK